MNNEQKKDDEQKSKNGEIFNKVIFILRAYTHLELAKLYGVSWPTLQKWIKHHEDEIGPKIGHFFNVRQVIIIFKLFGIPQKVNLSVQDLNTLF